MKRSAAVLLLCAITVGRLAGAEEQPKLDPEQQAKDFADTFMKAMLAKKLDAVMKSVDVPWYNDKKEIIKETEALKKHFKELFAEKDFSKLKYKVDRAFRYEKFREELKEKDRAQYDQVLAKDDYLVLVNIGEEREKEGVLLFVKFKGGKPRVVGLSD